MISYCQKRSSLDILSNNNMRMGNFKISYRHHDKFNHTRIVFAINDEQKSIVVSVRGTSNFDDVLTDLSYITISTKLSPSNHKKYFGEFPKDSVIHTGFLARFEKFHKIIFTKTRKLVEKYPSYSLIITGHSLGKQLTYLLLNKTLGGAHALIQAAYMSYLGMKIDAVFTYGQPKTGNRQFSDHLIKLLKHKVYRINTKMDIVQKMGTPFFGGHHSDL